MFSLPEGETARFPGGVSKAMTDSTRPGRNSWLLRRPGRRGRRMQLCNSEKLTENPRSWLLNQVAYSQWECPGRVPPPEHQAAHACKQCARIVSLFRRLPSRKQPPALHHRQEGSSQHRQHANKDGTASHGCGAPGFRFSMAMTPQRAGTKRRPCHSVML